MIQVTIGLLLAAGPPAAAPQEDGKQAAPPTAVVSPRAAPEDRPVAPHRSADGRYLCTAPPADLDLEPFYGKYVDADGLPVVSSRKVSDYALFEAAYLIDLMLAERRDIREALIKNGTRCVVMAHDEFTCDIPEYRWLQPRDYWDRRARGLGGSATDPIVSCAEENLLAFPGDPYAAENILIHEFAHTIHLRGLAVVDKTFDERLKKTHEQAIARGLWKNTYAATNHHEYWAEGVQSWFDNNRPPDHDHNEVDTRAELRAYDPDLAALIGEVFGKTRLVYIKPTERTGAGHLAGYDFAGSPTFKWPAQVEARYRKYLRAQSAAGGKDSEDSASDHDGTGQEGR